MILRDFWNSLNFWKAIFSIHRKKNQCHQCHAMTKMLGTFTINTVMSHERHVIWIHWQFKANGMQTNKALYYWPFERGIHWLRWIRFTKGPVIWKVFPHHDVSIVKMMHTEYLPQNMHKYGLWFVMPPPLAARSIMFLGCFTQLYHCSYPYSSGLLQCHKHINPVLMKYPRRIWVK